MKFDEALEEIQTHRFSSLLNLASDEGQFYKIAEQQPEVVTLARSVTSGGGDTREEVLGRIWDLSSIEIDPRFENPYDTSLAILLWLVSMSEPGFANVAAAQVDRAPQCWYAKKLARRMMFPPTNQAGPIGPESVLGGDQPMWISFGVRQGSQRFSLAKQFVNALSSNPIGPDDFKTTSFTGLEVMQFSSE